MNYYIIDGTDQIHEVSELIDQAIFPNYHLLDEAQLAFHFKNPTATVEEVRACAVQTVEIPPVDIEAYRAQTIEALDKLSLVTASRLSPGYKRENATLSLLADNGGIYSRAEAEAIIADANRIGALCRNERYRVVNLITKATTIDEISVAINNHQFDLLS